MKREILFLVVFFTLQICFKITPVLAQEIEATFAEQIQQDENSAGIKKVIETFFQSCQQRDVNSMMEQVSKNYAKNGKMGVIDFEKFKSGLEKMFKTSVDISITNLKILELNVSDGKATIFVEYNLKYYNLDQLKSIDEVQKREYALVKEDSAWKIVTRTRQELE